jgi:hypothetical protein
MIKHSWLQQHRRLSDCLLPPLLLLLLLLLPVHAK